MNTGGGSLSIDDLVKTGNEDIFTPDISNDISSENVDRSSSKQYLLRLLKALNPREQKVIQYFFGLNSNKIMNLREISDLLNISRERVRQIKEVALDKLRDLKLSRDMLAHFG